MPRLTPTRCLELHHRLRALRVRSDGSSFRYFETKDQLLLHMFFAPSKDWDDEKLLAHRHLVTTADKSLPHRAGRAVKYLSLVEQHVRDEPRRQQERLARLERDRSGFKQGRRSRQPIGTITVRAVVRPEPDVDQIARAIVDIAVRHANEDAERAEREQRTNQEGTQPSDRAA